MGRDYFSEAASNLTTLMFIYATFQNFFPKFLKDYIQRLWTRLDRYLHPYLQIRFDEWSYYGLYNGNDDYHTIETYLSATTTAQATCLKARTHNKSDPPALTLDDFNRVIDVFRGTRVEWFRGKYSPEQNTIAFSSQHEKRYYQLTFRAEHRELVTNEYLRYVLEKGGEIKRQRRERKLYMNSTNPDSGLWDSVNFEHPATFDTFALDPDRKQKIVDDLIAFSNSKDYYRKIGKSWKRGYLLYGPPGTGKSTMIASMANLLNYDIYDLELTTVKNNAQLKKLLVNTKGKSIIVIEDIDCSLDLTGKRKAKKDHDNNKNNKKNPILSEKKVTSGDDDDEKEMMSKVTLSGLLNFIDGIWSACGGERIFVFTTNHIVKLDPALIRTGRMDMHIQLSYCCFEAFKILANNYLGIDSHPLYNKVRELIGQVQVSPADVAENLIMHNASPQTCLDSLIKLLETAKHRAEIESTKEEEEEEEEEKLEEEEDDHDKSKNPIVVEKIESHDEGDPEPEVSISCFWWWRRKKKKPI